MRFSIAKGALLLVVAGTSFEACGGSHSDLFRGTNGPDASSSGGVTSGTTCTGAKDCAGRTDGRTVCDTTLHQCVKCASGSDCSGATDCVDHQCVSIVACVDSRGCPTNLVCDTALQICVECTKTSDCGAGQECVGDMCRTTCTSDKQCTAAGLLCDPVAGACVECLNDTQCSGTDVCVAGVCARPSGGAGGTTGAGGTAGTGGTAGAGGTTGTSGTTGAGGSGPGCGTRLDLWILADSSGSTGTTTYDTGTTWGYESAGIKNFVATNTGIGVGLMYTPAMYPGQTCCLATDCADAGTCVGAIPYIGSICLTYGTCSGSAGGDCSPTGYLPPAAPMTLLPDSGNVIGTAIDARTPSGSSPFASGLEAAREAAVASSANNPGGRTVIVLFADGAPNVCSDTWATVATVADTAYTGTPSIATYVVTLTYDPTNVAPVAQAGRTTAQSIPTGLTLAGATSAVTSALDQIVSDACR